MQNPSGRAARAALQLDEQGRCSEAVPIFERVLNDYPEDWYAWAGLADCYVMPGPSPLVNILPFRAADFPPTL